MTQGISNSLSLTLSRLSAIESNFSQLEKIALPFNLENQIQQTQNNQNTNQSFQSILAKKMEENGSKLEDIKENKIEDEEIPLEKIDKKEAIELKSKIDLKAQIKNIDEIIEFTSNKYGIDSDFIKALIKQESNFNTKATSKKGAMGLMQLMPSTAKSLGVKDAYNPSENIEGGVKYFKGLLDRFGNDKKLALAAYNAGSGAVKKYGGIPPYKETQNYIKSIMSTYSKLKEANI